MNPMLSVLCATYLAFASADATHCGNNGEAACTSTNPTPASRSLLQHGHHSKVVDKVAYNPMEFEINRKPRPRPTDPPPLSNGRLYKYEKFASKYCPGNNVNLAMHPKQCYKQAKQNPGSG